MSDFLEVCGPILALIAVGGLLHAAHAKTCSDYTECKSCAQQLSVRRPPDFSHAFWLAAGP